LKCKKNRIRLQ